MTSQKQKAALALTGAVALASGAYALGAQADDGAAVASGAPKAAFAHHGPGRAGPFALDRLADRLGVDEAKLRDALEDIRSDLPDPRQRRDEFAADLAKELGTTEAKIEAALDRVRSKHEAEAEDRRDALAEELANAEARRLQGEGRPGDAERLQAARPLEPGVLVEQAVRRAARVRADHAGRRVRVDPGPDRRRRGVAELDL